MMLMTGSQGSHVSERAERGVSCGRACPLPPPTLPSPGLRRWEGDLISPQRGEAPPATKQRYGVKWCRMKRENKPDSRGGYVQQLTCFGSGSGRKAFETILRRQQGVWHNVCVPVKTKEVKLKFNVDLLGTGMAGPTSVTVIVVPYKTAHTNHYLCNRMYWDGIYPVCYLIGQNRNGLINKFGSHRLPFPFQMKCKAEGRDLISNPERWWPLKCICSSSVVEDATKPTTIKHSTAVLCQSLLNTYYSNICVGLNDSTGYRQ